MNRGWEGNRVKRAWLKFAELSDYSDGDGLHHRIASLMIAFALLVTIVVNIFYLLTHNWHMLPGGIFGTLLCALSLHLHRRYGNAGKLVFVIAANFLAVLSHQQLHGLIPSYLYLFATGTGPLVLFHPRDIRYMVICVVISLVAGLVTTSFPNLFGMPMPSLPPLAAQLMIPIVWITAYSIAIAPPALLFLFTRKLHDKVLAEQAKRFHSSRLQSLGEVAAGVAHEINNPLAVVIGKVDAMTEALADPAVWDMKKFQSDLQLIEQNAEHIGRIVRSLQTFSRQGPRDRATPVSVKALVDDTLLLMKHHLEKHVIRLDFSCPDDCRISVISSEIMQALSNLISNAIDAMADLEADERQLAIRVLSLARTVQIEVADHGPGVPEAIVSRIFDPFFTTKVPGKGTGLGLSIVQEIMTRHHGQIRLERRDSQTVFIMEFAQMAGGIEENPV